MDVEKPEYLSSPHKVHVFSDLVMDGGIYKSSVKLPVHLRYHRPSSASGGTTVQLLHPDVLIKCNSTDKTG